MAHRKGNGEKSDHLAAEEHLEAWLGRNEDHRAALSQFFAQARLPNDWASSISIPKWAYTQAAADLVQSCSQKRF